MYFWYRNDLLRDLLTLLLFFSLPVVDEKLPRFIFRPRNGGGKINDSCYSKTVFLCFVLMKKQNKTRQKNCKPISKFLTSVTPKASPCWGRRRASPSRERLYWTRKYASYEKWFSFFFFFFSVVSFFIVCMKQFKFHNARCFCCCWWFPVDVPPFFVVTFFKCVRYTFSLLCSCCVHLNTIYLRCPPRLHYYYYCSVCVCVSVLCLHQLMTFYVWGFILSCARRCWTAWVFIFQKPSQENAMQRVAPCLSCNIFACHFFQRGGGGVIGSVYCCTVWEMENNWCLFFSVFPLSSLTYLPCSETSIISSNDVRTIYPIWCHFFEPFFLTPNQPFRGFDITYYLFF
jgi:hypothetical protein